FWRPHFRPYRFQGIPEVRNKAIDLALFLKMKALKLLKVNIPVSYSLIFYFLLFCESCCSVFIKQIHQSGHGSCAKLQLSFVYGIKSIGAGMVMVKIPLRIGS